MNVIGVSNAKAGVRWNYRYRLSAQMQLKCNQPLKKSRDFNQSSQCWVACKTYTTWSNSGMIPARDSKEIIDADVENVVKFTTKVWHWSSNHLHSYKSMWCFNRDPRGNDRSDLKMRLYTGTFEQFAGWKQAYMLENIMLAMIKNSLEWRRNVNWSNGDRYGWWPNNGGICSAKNFTYKYLPRSVAIMVTKDISLKYWKLLKNWQKASEFLQLCTHVIQNEVFHVEVIGEVEPAWSDWEVLSWNHFSARIKHIFEQNQTRPWEKTSVDLPGVYRIGEVRSFLVLKNWLKKSLV